MLEFTLGTIFGFVAGLLVKRLHNVKIEQL